MGFHKQMSFQLFSCVCKINKKTKKKTEKINHVGRTTGSDGNAINVVEFF